MPSLKTTPVSKARGSTCKQNTRANRLLCGLRPSHTSDLRLLPRKTVLTPLTRTGVSSQGARPQPPLPLTQGKRWWGGGVSRLSSGGTRHKALLSPHSASAHILAPKRQAQPFFLLLFRLAPLRASSLAVGSRGGLQDRQGHTEKPPWNGKETANKTTERKSNGCGLKCHQKQLFLRKRINNHMGSIPQRLGVRF